MRSVIPSSWQPPDCLITPDAGLERDPHSGHPIVFDHRIARHRKLIACADDQVDRPRRAVLADLEAPEYDARREQDLAKTLVFPVRPERVVHLEFGPEILPQVILKGGVPKNGIAEVGQILMGRIAR